MISVGNVMTPGSMAGCWRKEGRSEKQAFYCETSGEEEREKDLYQWEVLLETVVIELQLKVQLTEACFNRIQDHVSSVMVGPLEMMLVVLFVQQEQQQQQQMSIKDRGKLSVKEWG